MTEKTQPTVKKSSKKKLVRTAGGHFAPKNPTFSGLDLPQNVKTRLVLIGKMKEFGFKQDQIQRLLLDLYNEVVSAPSKDLVTAAAPTRGGVTQMVPISNIQASSLTPNFDSIRSHFVTKDAKHPEFKDYISAEEIGVIVGMKADNVKFFIKRYCNDKGHDLPNNDAEKNVVADGAYFKGLSKRLDGRLIPVHVNEKVGGIACWYLMEDGKIVWRNYWSPEAVEAIITLIPEDKKNTYLKTGKELNPFGDGALTEGQERPLKAGEGLA